MRIPAIFSMLVLTACGLAAAAETAKRPNLLFIYTDDHPYKTLGAWPEAPDWVRTPEIDKLAARGVRFPRAYCGSWCMPSRASLLTGRLPWGVESMRMEGKYPGSSYDPAKCPFWPAELRKHGYHTAQIGKWHTGTDTGFGRDWDHQIVWNRPLHPENAGNYYVDQVLAFDGVERQVSGYSTDNYTDWAVDYIRGQHREAGKPWYLWLCYGAIHGPTTPAPRHRGAYADQPVPVPVDIFGPRPDKPAYLELTQAWMLDAKGQPAMRPAAKRENNFDLNKPGLAYAAWVRRMNECVLAIDEGVGRVMGALRESGQLDNTLVIFTADQGFAMGEHGLKSKQAPYDASIAAGLIISQPGTWPEGRVCRQPVNSPDIVALLTTTAGLELPWKQHGRDIRPLLKNPETDDWDSPMLMCHTGHTYGSDTSTIPTGEALTSEAGVPWWVSLRQGKLKYVRTLVEGETEELYDLEADPEELVNLAAKSEQRATLEKLRLKTVDELRRTEAGFVEHMPRTKAMGEATAAR
jgi:arylsulfatase A-like enzyme